MVAAGVIGVWVFVRMTSLAGKMHTWSPPFSEYETWTLIAAGVAVLFLLIGIRQLTAKQDRDDDPKM